MISPLIIAHDHLTLLSCPTMFTSACSCINGRCDTGPQGTGHCISDSCRRGFEGVDCDRSSVPCGPQQDRCHAHLQCVNDTCECYQGYKGSGLECLPINPCLEPDGGNCDTSVVRSSCLMLLSCNLGDFLKTRGQTFMNSFIWKVWSKFDFFWVEIGTWCLL